MSALSLALLLSACAATPAASPKSITLADIAPRAGIQRLTEATTAPAEEATAARRQTYFVMDAKSGRVLDQSGADALVYPASLTKMMTLYLTFEALSRGDLKMDQALPVSALAESQVPTRLGLKAGQTITVKQAILSLVVTSANDSAVVLAEAQAGSVEAFAKAMNDKAAALALNHTQFRNPHGLPDPEQVTSARDMVMLARALMADFPAYADALSATSFTFNGQTMKGHNRLLTTYPGADCCKTGYIGASGFNLVLSAERNGRRIIAAVFGGETAPARDRRMVVLLDRGFDALARDKQQPMVAVLTPDTVSPSIVPR